MLFDIVMCYLDNTSLLTYCLHIVRKSIEIFFSLNAAPVDHRFLECNHINVKVKHNEKAKKSEDK